MVTIPSGGEKMFKALRLPHKALWQTNMFSYLNNLTESGEMVVPGKVVFSCR